MKMLTRIGIGLLNGGALIAVLLVLRSYSVPTVARLAVLLVVALALYRLDLWVDRRMQ